VKDDLLHYHIFDKMFLKGAVCLLTLMFFKTDLLSETQNEMFMLIFYLYRYLYSESEWGPEAVKLQKNNIEASSKRCPKNSCTTS